MSALPFERIDAYDRRHFPAPRSGFLEDWIRRPGCHALAAVAGDDTAVMRPCRIGYDIGPLFPANAGAAESLLVAVASWAPNEPVFLDVPQTNDDALALVPRYRMREVFGCAPDGARSNPGVAGRRIFGVTTFELG